MFHTRNIYVRRLKGKRTEAMYQAFKTQSRSTKTSIEFVMYIQYSHFDPSNGRRAHITLSKMNEIQ